MPYPNFHAARVRDPDDFEWIKVLKHLPNGAMIYGGDLKKGTGGTVTQAIRFPRAKFSAEQARTWMKEHDEKVILFEEATGQQDGFDFTSDVRFDYMDYKRGTCKRTDEGYLQGMAPVARVGVMNYRLADGTVRREFVPPETLFNKDSMSTLRLKPITNSHPPETLIDRTTVKARKVGFTGETVQQDDVFLMASLVVTDDDAIADVDGGRRQLSPGYRCDLRLEAGAFNGQDYDAVQVNRRYNHLALVDAARGGASLQLNVDRADGIEITEERPKEQPLTKEKRMPLVKIDGISYEAPAEVVRHVEKQDAALAKAAADVQTAVAKTDSISAERDTLKAKVDTLEKVDVAAEARKIATARTSLERQVTPHLDEETVKKIDTLTDADLRKAVILKAFPKADAQLANASDVYVQARFDSALEMLSNSTDTDGDAAQRAAAKTDSTRTDGAGNVPDSDKSRNDMAERARNAWKVEEKK